MNVAKLTRVYHFSAAHRLHSPYLGDEENRALYRDCNNHAGHGHNYVLSVTLKGSVAPGTGMLFDLVEFDRIVHDRVIRHLDHQFIGAREFPKDVGEGAFISTSEALTHAIWTWLEGAFPQGVYLFRVRLEETGSNHFEYHGEDPPGVTEPPNKEFVT